MSKQSELWFKIISDTSKHSLLSLAMHHVTHTVSDMIGRPLEIKDIRLKTYSISEMMVYDDDPEAETVAVYLRISNDLPGEAMLILTPNDAMYLADWLLELRPGTTTFLNDLERSALAEVGNLTLSSFLNAIADLTDTPLAPSPPAVRIDMLATLLEAVVTLLAEHSNDLLVLKTDFINVQSELLIQFWLLPDPAVIKPTEI